MKPRPQSEGAPAMGLRFGQLAGLALLLAAGVFALALALGSPSPPGVGAQSASLINTVAEVDGGRVIDEELTFKVNPPTASYLESGDKIKITFPTDFKLSNSVSGIELSSSGDGANDSPIAITQVDSGPNGVLTLTLPTNGVPANRLGTEDHLVITIAANNSIKAPETPKGFDDDSSTGYAIKITFIDTHNNNKEIDATDKNFIVVKNPVSSPVPGDRVRIVLATYANVDIAGNEEITVDFSGPSADSEFILPSTITTRLVTIRTTDNEGKSLTFSPSDVLVLGTSVILTVPEDRLVKMGDYTIEFSQSARIRNPYSAGNPKIKVSSTAPGDEEVDEITAVILRTTTVSPAQGPRGSEFTLSGKGYAKGTVTVFDGDDDKIEPGETLASVKTSRGSFTARLEARGEPGKPKYKVWTRDSNGAIHSAEFDIRSSMSFHPSTVGIGDRLKITIVDWEEDEDNPDHQQEVAAVHIGGVKAFIATPIEYDNCIAFEGQYFANAVTGMVSFNVTVPQGVPPGEQTVAVYGHDELVLVDDSGQPISTPDPCVDLPDGTSEQGTANKDVKVRVKDNPTALVEKTIEVATQSLTLSRSEAARGQRITISGSGFSPAAGGGGIKSVTINAIPVADAADGFRVDASGSFAFTVVVPVGAAVGANEVRVVGADDSLATGTLTVSAASIELDPPESRRGEPVRVTGAGFIANRPVWLQYGDGSGLGGGDIHVGSAMADGAGGFDFTFAVPVTAEIGRAHKVTAMTEVENITVRAEAVHSPPGAAITTSPEQAFPGDTLTITGSNLPAFALVRSIDINGIHVTPQSNLGTDGSGAFEAQVVVPWLELGDQLLRVEVAGVVATRVISVVHHSVARPPAVVFAPLIAAGALGRVWLYDNSDQEWYLYDPDPEFAEFNTLTKLDAGQIVWMNLTKPATFQDEQRQAGWNLVRVR